MPYHIETFDKPASGNLRQATRAAHLAFLSEQAQLLLACGAKLDEAGIANGSVYIVDVDTHDAAAAFIAADPFSKVDLFREVRITRWRQAYLNRECYLS